ncbi:hypothetical protein G6F70_000467 [Rhizopus microsporus]|uniref:Glycosyltransferase family 49 protein n=2 Tax=Rhizopus TaxID=4842 RepID=A0A367JKU4_RHIAZ|nr:hypothetical protein G6F71_000311 [Rhizopus microsporus]RCH90562.1 hypothetical protein CU097_011872 [Rhizopus azygosporus]KAG1204429.1 hypothetical protein G6F70_000467 [Rhizopus microsporus]KAG1215887.1 hypothetical protein G6F69_000613 [Rhizopus microsporus]KAG1238555.1 hypothetical protein G6F67_000350 [Rhizopus microsporus]
MKGTRLLVGAIRWSLYIYLIGAFIYSTLYLVTFGWYSKSTQTTKQTTTISQLGTKYNSSQLVSWKNDQAEHTIPEQQLLSKVFSDAMGPGKVIPYYFKATDTFDSEDISIATLVTHNRFPVLSRLATRYKGPISAAIHVNDDHEKHTILKDLHSMYEANPDMARFVDIHLIVDKFDRQFNMWRNAAKLFARTEYIMMLDVDFHLCTDFRQSLKRHTEVMDKLRQGKGAVVIPAFEFIMEQDGEDWRTFPTEKNDLMTIVQQGKIDMFHLGWTRGHGSTNYSKWYESSQPYKVTDYNYSYEPYVIYKKEGSPWCDERFIGYGANKAACLYEIYLAGIDYWVLPDDFLIHQTHHYPEDTRAKERKYNKKLYDYYREEACLRYSRLMISAGLWETSEADNLKRECNKIKGFKEIVARVL